MKKHIIIIGKVQGVGFRYWFLNKSKFLKLNGFVENNINDNNIVFAVVQGKITNIHNLINKCKIEDKEAKIDKLIYKSIFSSSI